MGLAGRTLPFTSHNAVVKTFRQALALDERRAKFRHSPWSRTANGIQTVPQQPDTAASMTLDKERPSTPKLIDETRDIPERQSDMWDTVLSALRVRQHIDPVYYWQDDRSVMSELPSLLEARAAMPVSEKSPKNTETPQVHLEKNASLPCKVVRQVLSTIALRRKVDAPPYREHCNTGRRDERRIHCDYCSYDWQKTCCREVWFAGSHSGARFSLPVLFIYLTYYP